MREDFKTHNHLVMLSQALYRKRKSVIPRLSIVQLCNNVCKKQHSTYSLIENGKISFSIDTLLSYLEGIKSIKQISDKNKFRSAYGYFLEQNRYKKNAEITRNDIRKKTNRAYSIIWGIETGVNNYRIDNLFYYLTACDIIKESPELIEHVINFCNNYKMK